MAKSEITVISLADPQTVLRLFERLGHTSIARRKLRRDMFAKIARSSKLQHQLLTILAKHPRMRRRILLELAKDAELMKRFVKIAGE